MVLHVINESRSRVAERVAAMLKSSKSKPGHRVFGSAGAMATRYLHDPQLSRGVDRSYVEEWYAAQTTTGEILSKWVWSRDDAVLVESVKFSKGREVRVSPSSEFHGIDPRYGVDHVLIVGNAVFFIDSRGWEFKKTHTVSDGRIMVGGEEQEEEPVPYVVENADRFIDMVPEGTLTKVVVHTTSGKYKTKRDPEWYRAPFSLSDHEHFIGYITRLTDNQLPNDAKGFIDAGLVSIFAARATKGMDKFSAFGMTL